MAATTLSASGAATLNSTLSISGATTAATVSCTSLTASGNMVGAVQASTLSASGAATLSSTLSVAGATTAAALTTSGLATLNRVQVGDTSDSTLGLSIMSSTMAAGSLRGLCVGQAAGNFNRAELFFFYQGSGLATNRARFGLYGVDGVSVWGNGFVGVNAGSTQPTAQLSVTGTLAASGSAALTGIVNAGTISSTGAVSAPILASTLSASGATTLNSTLSVSGSTSAAAVSCSSLSSSGNISGPVAATVLSASGAATLSGSLGVSGATTTAGISCTTLTSTGTIAGPLAATTLSASGAATLSSTLNVGTATNFAPLTVQGDVMFGSNAGVPTSIANEVGGSTPVVNLSMNFRETNKNTANFGGAFRMDGRSTSQYWQFLYRAAGSTSENVVASVSSTGALAASGSLAVAGTSAFTGNVSLINNSSTALAIVNSAGNGASAYINMAGYNTFSNGYPLTLTCADNNYSADLVVSTKTPGAAGNSQVERFRVSNAGTVSMAGQISSGYHYITGVDGNSRSIVSLASGNAANAIIWGQALSNNNSAVLGYNNATASTATLGIYGSTPLSVDANGTTKVAKLQVGTSSDTARQISCLQSGLATGTSTYVTVGQDASNNNQAELGFSYAGSGSSSNRATLGLFGAPIMSIDGGGNVYAPGPLTANNTATIFGTGTRQITCKNPSTNTSDAAEIYYDCTAAGGSAQSAFGMAGPAAGAISNGNAPTRGAYWWVNGSDRININPSTGAVAIAGALSKGSGTFQIRHPLAPETTDLVHSFVEGPRCDLIYRGRTRLTEGVARVEIDAECTGNGRGMRAGTFEALCRNPQVYLQNNETWAKVMGHVEGGSLYVCCEDPAAECLVDWMVVAERQDEHVRRWDKTDSEGHLVLEWDRQTSSLN